MDKKEKIQTIVFWLFVILIIGLEVLNLFSIQKIPEVLEQNKDFRYGWSCSEFKFKSPEDAKNGWGCLLNQCETISNDPLEEECVCVLNNLTVNRICTIQSYIRQYPYPTYSKPQEIKLNQTQYNQIMRETENEKN